MFFLADLNMLNCKNDELTSSLQPTYVYLHSTKVQEQVSFMWSLI